MYVDFNSTPNSENGDPASCSLLCISELQSTDYNIKLYIYILIHVGMYRNTDMRVYRTGSKPSVPVAISWDLDQPFK